VAREGLDVDAVTGTPAPRLAGLVRRYCGYRYLGFPAGTHLGLPSPDLTVVLSLGPPTRLAAMPDAGQAPGEFVALAGGLHTRAAVIAHDGDQFGVQLELTPAGARSLFGMPAGALAGTVVCLDDVLGLATAELLDRMAAAPGWAARFAVLDEVLSRIAGRAAAEPPELTHAWRRLVGTCAPPVAEVAAEVGWSRRNLGSRFAREYGVTPKQAARLARFSRARRLLQRSDRPTLAAVAADSGYCDQAHLAHEWNDLAGCPPSAWLADEDFLGYRPER
jgi:AraC-like DNA-binding protein